MIANLVLFGGDLTLGMVLKVNKSLKKKKIIFK